MVGGEPIRIGTSLSLLVDVVQDGVTITQRRSTAVMRLRTLPNEGQPLPPPMGMVHATESALLTPITADPTRCGVQWCGRENELLVHLSDDPWGGADLCLEHAKAAMSASWLALTCTCPLCVRARSVLWGIATH